MRPLPKSYMTKTHAQRAKMHEDVLIALENASSTTLQNIVRQLANVDAKRMLMREMLVALNEGQDLYSVLVQIDSTIEKDAKYEE
tara:strand:+ start:1387 stop:1641 length:255 start_codon:yes stop_codon:yes gene_type:complete